MEQKAQGSIEYLLIIGAAILVVAIVVIALTTILATGQENADPQQAVIAQDTLGCQGSCTYDVKNTATATDTCKELVPTKCP